MRRRGLGRTRRSCFCRVDDDDAGYDGCVMTLCG